MFDHSPFVIFRKSMHAHTSASADFMNVTIRQFRMMTEMETMDPDIACFQEIDQAWYDSFWLPQLSVLGYEGLSGMHDYHPNKVGQAIFWKKVNALFLIQTRREAKIFNLVVIIFHSEFVYK